MSKDLFHINFIPAIQSNINGNISVESLQKPNQLI
jgi:hypothetical protein